EMSLALAHALLRFAARRDVATDAQDADRLAARVALDAIRPGDPYALAVAAHVLVDVLLERLRRGADLIHQRFEIAAAAFGFGHVHGDDVPGEYAWVRLDGGTPAEHLKKCGGAVAGTGESSATRPRLVLAFRQFAMHPVGLGPDEGGYI